MQCLKCNSESFEEKGMPFDPEIRGEKVFVIATAFVCKKCQTSLMDSAQMNTFRKIAVDQYRKNHQLLSSDEIISIRQKLEMSQMEFAEYLHVSEKDVIRWETYYTQDKGLDDRIRRCSL